MVKVQLQTVNFKHLNSEGRLLGPLPFEAESLETSTENIIRRILYD